MLLDGVEADHQLRGDALVGAARGQQPEDLQLADGQRLDQARRPGLIQAQLARVDDQTWVDTWRWESRGNAQAAIANVPNIPEAGAAFSLTRDATAEFADVVDER